MQGPVPSSVPLSAHDGPPDFRGITRGESERNLARLRRECGLDTDWASVDASAEIEEKTRDGRIAGGREAPRTATSSIAQQEKEFQKAVQPGSPISALLSSARTPLVVGPAAPGGGGVRESPLLRKLQAAAGGRGGDAGARVGESPLGRRSVVRGADGGYVDVDAEDGLGPLPGLLGRGVGSLRRRNAGGDEEVDEEERGRKKELEAQKARIVAQMAPVKEEEEDAEEEDEERDEEEVEREERPLPALPKSGRDREREREKETRDRGDARRRYGVDDDRENVPPRPAQVPVPSAAKPSKERDLGKAKEKLGASGSMASLNGARGGTATATTKLGGRSGTGSRTDLGASSSRLPTASSSTALAPEGGSEQKLNGFDAAAQMLGAAFEARAEGREFRRPDGSAWGDVEEERVFIVSWVDYCNKYGMGYALTDGSVGVHFNDSTSLVLSGGKG